MHVYVASSPTITSNVTDRCILQGRNVNYTCKVTYNGSDLMPLYMLWYLSTSRSTKPGYYNRYIYIPTNSTVDESSIHRSSLTVTANETIAEFWCRVRFSRPTGSVLSYRVEQYTNTPYQSFWSTPFASRTVASKVTVYIIFTHYDPYTHY